MFNENLVGFCPLKDASKLVEFVSKEQVMCKIASIFQFVLYIKLFLQCSYVGAKQKVEWC